MRLAIAACLALGSVAFAAEDPIADAALLAVFFNPADASAAPTYLHFGGRAHRRV